MVHQVLLYLFFNGQDSLLKGLIGRKGHSKIISIIGYVIIPESL